MEIYCYKIVDALHLVFVFYGLRRSVFLESRAVLTLLSFVTVITAGLVTSGKQLSAEKVDSTIFWSRLYPLVFCD